jgi:hypothetical protein
LQNPSNPQLYACEEVDIEPFRKLLPKHLQEHINLCRVFLLKAGCRLPSLEVHRNSIQRLVSFKNRGAIHIADSNQPGKVFWKHELVSPEEGTISKLSDHWNIVPANTWHYPEASPAGDWCTVTFHSASSAEIIDEYRQA